MKTSTTVSVGEDDFIDAETLYNLIQNATAQGCRAKNGQPEVTLLDLRTEVNLPSKHQPAKIKMPCAIEYLLLDDLQKEAVRARVPRQGTVITITETGNRDRYAIHYLAQYGFRNVKGLLFGMRGWIKAGYPIQK